MNSLRRALPSFTGSLTSSSDAPFVPPPLESSLRDHLSSRQTSLTRLQAAFSQFVTSSSKQKLCPTPSIKFEKDKNIPLYWVGQEFVGAGDAFTSAAQAAIGDDDEKLDAYGSALSTFGTTHLQLADLTTSYLDSLSSSFLPALDLQLEKFSDYEKALKDADKLRTTLVNALTKVQKAKKDTQKTEAEEEVEAVEREYEDACDTVKRRIAGLDSGAGRDLDKLKELLDVQLGFAKQFHSTLLDCQSSLSSYVPSPSTSQTPTKRHPPALPSRTSTPTNSSSLAPPPTFQTRMSRSHSDSSAMHPPPSRRPTPNPLSDQNSPSSIISGRARSDSKGDGEKKDKESRSRSGSILGRFTGGSGSGRNSPVPRLKILGGGKDKDKDKNRGDKDGGGESDEEGGEGETGENLEEGSDADSYSPTTANSTTSAIPSFARGLPTLPTLSKPSLPSLRKKGGKYDSLDSNSNELDLSELLSSTTPSSRPSPRRNQTTSSLSSSLPYSSNSTTPIGKLFKASWDFPATDVDELRLLKNDIVRIEKEVNDDWWKGVKISGGISVGERGMFPRNFVVPFTDLSTSTLNSTPKKSTSTPTTPRMSSFVWHSESSDTQGDGDSSEDDDEEEEELEEEGDKDRKKVAGLLASAAMGRVGSGGSSSGGTRKAPPPPPTRRRITVSGGESPFADGN